MPRPRTVSDQEILAATARAIGRVGPMRLTLAAVGSAVGLSPATLLQRFGSKRGLLLALAADAATSVPATFASARAGETSPLAAVQVVLLAMARTIGSPEELAHHLAFLQVDLSDPEFRGHAVAHADAVLAGLRQLIVEATTAGELRPTDPDRLAQGLYAIWNGSLLQWALYREGALAGWLGDRLTTFIEGYRPHRDSSGHRGGRR